MTHRRLGLDLMAAKHRKRFLANRPQALLTLQRTTALCREFPFGFRNRRLRAVDGRTDAGRRGARCSARGAQALCYGDLLLLLLRGGLVGGGVWLVGQLGGRQLDGASDGRGALV